jgi:hypothetical protein
MLTFWHKTGKFDENGGGLMKITVSVLCIILFCGTINAQAQVNPKDPFETALSEIGMSKESLTFDYGDMSNYGGDKFFLPLFYTLHSSPFKIEHYCKQFRKDVLNNCGSTRALTSFCSRRINEGVRRGLISNPIDQALTLLDSETPLYDAIVNFEKIYTIAMDQNDRKKLKEKTAILPVELQKMAALIIYSSIDSLRHHQRAFSEASKKFNLEKMYQKAIDFVSDEESWNEFDLEPLLETVNFKYLYTPAQDIAMALDYVSDSLAKMSFNQEFEFEWETSVGKIVINDADDHEYKNDNYFLIIDIGGNDMYKNAAANMNIRNWISILIDVNGNDIYQSYDEEIPCFGAGLFGYAYLIDLAGDDSYIGHNVTQGVGLFGVGLLMDKSGNDSYDAYVCAQGSGTFGQGILADLSGTDKYHMYQLGQGFGFTKGMGLLVDSSGNDIYIANDETIDFPASQSKEHNSSLCQGVGFGKRADFVDGHSWAGGIGMLIDGYGDDSYSAGLFAQGCAYWYAIGLLSDLEGNDVYNGIWYVQGSGAHFGLGILLESGGDDRYNATMNMAQGAGHDFTLGILIDESGNDIHNAPNLSLGGGNANGFGIFWDKRGDDSYSVSKATTLGRSNVASRGGLRDHILCLGLFLDTGGNDTYPSDTAFDFAKNNTLWIQHGTNAENPLEVEKGVGYDCEWEDNK